MTIRNGKEAVEHVRQLRAGIDAPNGPEKARAFLRGLLTGPCPSPLLTRLLVALEAYGIELLSQEDSRLDQALAGNEEHSWGQADAPIGSSTRTTVIGVGLGTDPTGCHHCILLFLEQRGEGRRQTLSLEADNARHFQVALPRCLEEHDRLRPGQG